MSKYDAPSGPPPNYPQQPPQAHYDAGPAGGDPRGANGGYYGSPAPQQQYGAPNPQYGAPGPYGQPGYGQPGPYQQQPMMYQQQGYPPQGQYQDGRQGGSSGPGCCAGIFGALACCCCLDMMF